MGTKFKNLRLKKVRIANQVIESLLDLPLGVRIWDENGDKATEIYLECPRFAEVDFAIMEDKPAEDIVIKKEFSRVVSIGDVKF